MPAPYTFCVNVDFNYLTRSLALYESLTHQARVPFVIWVLCADDRTYAVYEKLALPQVRLVRLAELETAYPALAAVKNTRSTLEYIWTCKASLLWYVLEQDPSVDRVTYLDADLYFFSDPQPMLDEIEKGSTVIVPHRFAPHMAGRAKRGIYNAGFLSFKCDEDGLMALDWWRERCIEWCYDRIEGPRLAEQKYLDDWPTRFKGVLVLEDKTINLAAWNWMTQPITRNAEGVLLVEGRPLIFYHYAVMRAVNQWLYDTNLTMWEPMPAHLRHWIYDPYARVLRQQWQRVKAIDPSAILMDRVMRTRWGPRVFLESLLAGQIGWF